MHAECGFGCIRDANGSNVFSHRSALSLLESFATLEVGGRADFQGGVGSLRAPRREDQHHAYGDSFDSAV
jgi:cold shock CspA family protein